MLVLTTTGQPPDRTLPDSLFDLASDLLRRSWLAVDVEHFLDDYAASQWFPPERLRALQLASLRRLAWHCYLNVPYYRLHIGDRLRASELDSLDDPARLPVQSGRDRRRHSAAFRSLVNAPPLGALRYTAATCGRRQEVALSREAVARQIAVRSRAERWAGAPPARVVGVCGRDLPHPPQPVERIETPSIEAAVRRSHEALVSLPGDALPLLAPMLGEVTRGQVSALVVRGPAAAGPSLASAIGARFFSWYAATEVGLIAAPCERAEALHVAADHLLLEIVDENGHAVAPGTVGRVLVTDLHNYSGPYLRHELGDVARLLPHACPCGRALPLIELVGRAG